MRKRKITLTILMMMLFVSGVKVGASHTHRWEGYGDCVYVDGDKHKASYYCDMFDEDRDEYCEETKQVLEKHTLTPEEDTYCEYKDEKDHWKIFDCLECRHEGVKKVQEPHVFGWEVETIPNDASTHKKEIHCDECYGTYYILEKHSFDKYGWCEECDYTKITNSTLESGKWKYASGNPWHKIVIKKDGYIKIEGQGSDKSQVDFAFYNKSKKKYKDMYEYVGRKICSILPVKKGTYYIRQTGTYPYQIRYTFKTAKDQKNYTKKKAVSLKAGKVDSGIIYSLNSKKTWTRWYKIKLNTTKRISIYCNNQSSSSASIWPCVYDSKGNYIQINYDYDYDDVSLIQRFVSEDKLKKGTYYIQIEYNWNNLEKKKTTGAYYDFKWK